MSFLGSHQTTSLNNTTYHFCMQKNCSKSLITASHHMVNSRFFASSKITSIERRETSAKKRESTKSNSWRSVKSQSESSESSKSGPRRTSKRPVKPMRYHQGSRAKPTSISTRSNYCKRAKHSEKKKGMSYAQLLSLGTARRNRRIQHFIWMEIALQTRKRDQSSRQ